MKSLYILDASGYLYRSYFAIRNVTNSKGESTNALYGFIRSVLKLKKDFSPTYLVSIFDGPRSGQKREEIYSEYKAHRASTPPDLGYQIGWAQQACQLMGIPYVTAEGVEADDTMGSIALWAEKQGFHVYICTSDKDLCQMVNSNISILNTFKENLVSGPSEVERDFGVTPAQIIDFLAITGDTSDNVPGIPGFGPKTASTLLKQYGTLDYILEHPEVVSGKKQEVLIQNKEKALISRKLVTIDTSVDFPKEETFFALKPVNLKPLKEFYAQMNFNSLIRELDQQPDLQLTQQAEELPPAQEATVTYQLVNDEESLQQLIRYLNEQSEICIHLKGTHEQPIKSTLIGIAFCVTPQHAWYVPANGKLALQKVLAELKPLFENPNIHFSGHNIKYDLQLLENYGIQLASISFDTMLASYLLSSHARQHTFDYLMQEHLGKTQKPISDIIGKGKKAVSLSEVFPEEIFLFFCDEVDSIRRLQIDLTKKLEERSFLSLLKTLDLPLLRVLAKMERRGIFLDKPYLAAMSKEVIAEIKRLELEIYELAGETFNLNSPKQLSEILFTKMGIKPPRKTATGLSTDADVMESLKAQYPIAGKILEYRTVEKLRSTYIESLPAEVYSKTQRIHCTFNQTVAATGRLSCQDPNLQNIPIRSEIGRKIRQAFKPEKEGWSYLAADYSQIELRLLAHLSEDPQLIHAFAKGEDIHTHTASLIFNVPLDQVTKAQRYQAKAVNFGVIYGQQAYGLSQELGIEVKEAAAFIEMYFKQYPRVKQYLEESKQRVRETGKAVTEFGRERLIPEIHSKNGQIRALAERLAVNTPLQGTAADLIKQAMLDIDKALQEKGLKSYMILQVHDELIFEAPDEELPVLEPIVRRIMQEVLKLKVPLIVDLIIGKNWAEC